MDSTRVGGAPVTTAHYARFSAVVLSGFLAAMIGGLVMAAVMVVAFTGFGRSDLSFALRPIGAFLYGDAMMLAPTTAMYLAAIALLLGVCALWGLVFAAAATLLRVDKSFSGALTIGLNIGLASQIIDVNLLTPPLMFRLWGHDLWSETVPPLYSWIAHVAFGMSFALAPAFFRTLWLRFSGRDDVLAGDPRIK
jgi:hypothetical protein